jgi:hypothetical protein
MGRAGGAQPSVLLDLEPKKMDVTSYRGRTLGKNPLDLSEKLYMHFGFLPKLAFFGDFLSI